MKKTRRFFPILGAVISIPLLFGSCEKPNKELSATGCTLKRGHLVNAEQGLKDPFADTSIAASFAEPTSREKRFGTSSLTGAGPMVDEEHSLNGSLLWEDDSCASFHNPSLMGAWVKITATEDFNTNGRISAPIMEWCEAFDPTNKSDRPTVQMARLIYRMDVDLWHISLTYRSPRGEALEVTSPLRSIETSDWAFLALRWSPETKQLNFSINGESADTIVLPEIEITSPGGYAHTALYFPERTTKEANFFVDDFFISPGEDLGAERLKEYYQSGVPWRLAQGE